MPAPLAPRYISPEERAETRARVWRFVIFSVATLAIFMLAMLFAYTDQAPAWLRRIAFQIDAAFGFPVLALIQSLMM